MNREKFLKMLIKQKGYTIKSFATKIGIPYTTLLSMLNGSIGGAAVKTAIKICEELSISVESLKNEDVDESSGYYTSPEAAKMAQELYDNPGMMILFDAARNVPAEDLKAAAELIARMKKQEEHDEE
ncbi:MAG TPA: helix-turn-helix transcriptional regulator [Candidatus Avacidaminococcus intestinavium]|uniref:Helix-turn-helix transcriptional regulator n=1 Tax=Candidatus Avacidaminococcus intestinavium TaxID=2840684 RepID=A0A9D1MR20_9FIRM|nr:helix-turn-helix transcriptional regulator [Candidatus Avacidaminococcus intestinavium]